MIISKGRAALPLTEDKDRIFHEIRQCLRLTGVTDYFKMWADKPGLLAMFWQAARPIVETRAFEQAADRLRAEAVSLADKMGRLSALGPAALGESQAYQAQAAVMLYHYANPKLLLLNSALELPARAGDLGISRQNLTELIERGAPERMLMLETVDERPDDPAVARVFRDYKKVLKFPRVGSDWRTLALWPGYLESAWERLRALAVGRDYERACRRLLECSRELAAALPRPTIASDDGSALAREAEPFAAVLAALALNIALLGLDWQAPEILRRSPFPARPRPGREAL